MNGSGLTTCLALALSWALASLSQSAFSQRMAVLARQEIDSLWQGSPVEFRLETSHSEDNAEGAFEIIRGDTLVVHACSESGLLYGAYFMLRSQAMGDGCLCQTFGARQKISQQPHTRLRALHEPDGIGGLQEQGLLVPYARRCAQVGINTVVIPTAELQRQDMKEANSILQTYGISLLPDTMTSVPCLTLPSDPRQQEELLFLAPRWQEILAAHPNDCSRMIMSESVICQPDVTVEGTTWSRHPMAVANWYAFGRLSWDPTLSPRQIAHEWLALSFTESPLFVQPMIEVMLASPNAGVAEVQRMIDIWSEMSRYVTPATFCQIGTSLDRQLARLLEAQNH